MQDFSVICNKCGSKANIRVVLASKERALDENEDDENTYDVYVICTNDDCDNIEEIETITLERGSV